MTNEARFLTLYVRLASRELLKTNLTRFLTFVMFVLTLVTFSDKRSLVSDFQNVTFVLPLVSFDKRPRFPTFATFVVTLASVCDRHEDRFLTFATSDFDKRRPFSNFRNELL